MRPFQVYSCFRSIPAIGIEGAIANAQSSALLNNITSTREIQEGSRSPEIATLFHLETLTDFYAVVMCSLYSHHTRIDPSTRNEFVGRNFLIERPRARRYPFAASIDLVDMESETKTREQITDLSVFGCQVNAQKPWAAGTRVRLRIIHRGAIFTAQGQVANVRRHSMGVVFSKMEQKDQAVLERWLAEARDTLERTTRAR